MTDHPEYRALLRAVLDAPEDDVPRLVLADWWDEHGEPDRAEFVRVQVELANETRKTYRPKLQRRIKTLLRGCVSFRSYPWINVVLDEWKMGFSADGWGYAVVPVVPSVHFRRGFVERISLPLAAFLAHAPAVFAGQPVTSVVLTGREPQGSDSWGYVRRMEPETDCHPYCLPPELWDLLPLPIDRMRTVEYKRAESREAALSALSRAAARYGRANAAGWTHEGKCERENAYWFGTRHVINNPSARRWSSAIVLCPDCSGTGRVTRPGLAPL